MSVYHTVDMEVQYNRLECERFWAGENRLAMFTFLILLKFYLFTN